MAGTQQVTAESTSIYVSLQPNENRKDLQPMNDHVREVYVRHSVRVVMKKQDTKDRNGFFLLVECTVENLLLKGLTAHLFQCTEKVFNVYTMPRFYLF